MIKYFVLCLVLLFSTWALADSNCNVLSIDYVNAAPVKLSTLSVDGYIAYVSDCPPCPAAAVCESCVKPHVIISEENETLKSEPDTLTPDQLILFPADANAMKQFVRGIRYRFRLLPDQDHSWVFTGKNADSILRGLRTPSWFANPPPCLK